MRDQLVALLVAGIHEVLQPKAVDSVGAQSNSIDLVGTFDVSGFQGLRYLPMLLPEHLGSSFVRILLILLACYHDDLTRKYRMPCFVSISNPSKAAA